MFLKKDAETDTENIADISQLEKDNLERNYVNITMTKNESIMTS